MFMKRICIATLLVFSVIVARAQFLLTPNNGLKCEDNVYTIKNAGSESENYHAAKRVIKQVIPDALIEEPEFEKTLVVNAEQNLKITLRVKSIGSFGIPVKGTYDYSFKYKLNVEAHDGKIELAFNELGVFVHHKHGGVWLHPSSGKSNALTSEFYVFKEGGDLGQVKAKQQIEEWANSLVLKIEQALK